MSFKMAHRDDPVNWNLSSLWRLTALSILRPTFPIKFSLWRKKESIYPILRKAASIKVLLSLLVREVKDFFFIRWSIIYRKPLLNIRYYVI